MIYWCGFRTIYGMPRTLDRRIEFTRWQWLMWFSKMGRNPPHFSEVFLFTRIL
jgi:hypothetical protein